MISRNTFKKNNMVVVRKKFKKSDVFYGADAHIWSAGVLCVVDSGGNIKSAYAQGAWVTVEIVNDNKK